jgi:hypothetical protein
MPSIFFMLHSPVSVVSVLSAGPDPAGYRFEAISGKPLKQDSNIFSADDGMEPPAKAPEAAGPMEMYPDSLGADFSQAF